MRIKFQILLSGKFPKALRTHKFKLCTFENLAYVCVAILVGHPPETLLHEGESCIEPKPAPKRCQSLRMENAP